MINQQVYNDNDDKGLLYFKRAINSHGSKIMVIL